MHPLVNHTMGSVHTGLSICELAPDGTLDPHVHSFEEGFYILSGEAIVAINDQAYLAATPATTASRRSARCTRGATSARRRCAGFR